MSLLQDVYRPIRRVSIRWPVSVVMFFSVLLAAEVLEFHLLEMAEARLGDAYARRHAPMYAPHSDIVVLNIDDESLREMQTVAGLWPWPRETYADLLQALKRFEPKAVLFDIPFAERDPWRPKSDARFSKALRDLPNTYLAAVFLEGQPEEAGHRIADLTQAFGDPPGGSAEARAPFLLPHAVDRQHWRLGLINALEDEDGVLRRYYLNLDLAGWKIPSLPARVAKELQAEVPAGPNFLIRWPQENHQEIRFGVLYKILTEQSADLKSEDWKRLDAMLRGKIFVIGSSAAASFDHHLTPLRSGYPGVYVLAIALDNLLSGRVMRPISPWWPIGLGIALAALLSFSFRHRFNPLIIGGGLFIVSAAALAFADAAIERNLQVRIATPLIFAWTWFLLSAFGGYLRERRNRNQTVSLFGRFLNPAVVQQIVREGETVESLSGRSCNISLLFSDIRGFTSMSEKMDPQDMVKLLNRYFSRQVEVVFEHGGTLDKFIGDCIMAFWGAPVDNPNHARHAVDTALAMQDTLLAFRQELLAEGREAEDFDVGIGVHSGLAVVGFIGAKRKLEYTAIGDTVNLASRVEGLTRGVARVLVTEETMRACGDPKDLEFRFCGAFDVKGRSAQVKLYEPSRKNS